jgi:hypothetical protein
MSGYRKYIFLLGLLFGFLVLVEYYRPKPINWEQTFSNKDKIPYGTYILYQMLPALFKNADIRPVRLPISNLLEDEAIFDEESNYVFINQEFTLDSLDLAALLDYVAAGHNVFISAQRFPGLLRDTLHFDTAIMGKSKNDSVGLLFTHPTLKNKLSSRYHRQKVNFYFDSLPGTQANILGKTTTGEVNFVRVPLGAGSFYLHSVPLAFANYHVITNRGADYAALALSHLPIRTVYWDEYQKQGRQQDDSEFRVLLAHEPLRWAYYVTLSGLLLFLLFESKRTQRIIPVLEKPRNTTLEFVQVVGNLYFNYKNHKIIAEKKINYFLEFLRRHYHETNTTDLDREFQERIAAKSGVALTQILELFDLTQNIKAAASISEAQLWALNKKLENFYAQASR